MTLDTIVFDLDDTLLDERPGRRAGRAAMERTIGEARPDLSMRELNASYDRERDWFWDDSERHRRGRLDLAGARFEVLRRALRALGHDDEPLARRAASEFVAAHEAALVLMRDTRGVLAEARKRARKVVLLSNGARRPQRAKLERFELAGWFDHVQIEGEFGIGKPELEVFQAAVEAVGARPEQALMVGNDWQHDVVGALRAGLEAVWVDLHRRGPPGPPPRRHATIGEIGELPAQLEAHGL